MSKNTFGNRNVEQAKPAPAGGAVSCWDAGKASDAPGQPHKSKLERTQSLLTVISTSIGLMGVVGSALAMGISTFCTGAIEVRPNSESTPVIVKVYGKDGHESVFHTKHIELMPGDYHLEISSTDSKSVVHADTKVQFHKTNTVPVSFGRSAHLVDSISTSSNVPDFARVAQTEIATAAGNILGNLAKPRQDATPAQQEPAAESESTLEAKSTATDSAKKHHWWQIWKRSSVVSRSTDDKQQ